MILAPQALLLNLSFELHAIYTKVFVSRVNVSMGVELDEIEDVTSGIFGNRDSYCTVGRVVIDLVHVLLPQ